MERNLRLDWQGIVGEAKRRRKARGLTQQHLAALAKVGRSTLLRFENEKADITLSSVLRILGVLDMLDRKVEGALLIRRSGSAAAGHSAVMFSPNVGGGAMEQKNFDDQQSLDAFLADLGISPQLRKQTILELDRTGDATIPRVQLGQGQLESTWPIQFSAKR
jgi:transcriptional regulator with XRE-family HTH domain